MLTIISKTHTQTISLKYCVFAPVLMYDLPKLIFIVFNYFILQKSAFHRPQTLNYKNGFALPRRPTVGIGQDPLVSEQLLQQELSDFALEAPDISYGSLHEGLSKEFIPAHVALDKKV